MLNLIEIKNAEGEFAYLLPNNIVYFTQDVDRDVVLLHLTNGEVVEYYGTVDELSTFVRRGRD